MPPDQRQSAENVRRRPRLLDLFCCAGGAAMGYHRAGFEVVGVDIDPQPNYPFEFHQADAMMYPLDGFDVIHASPPCQSYSDLAKRNGNGHAWPRLVTPTRERLVEWGLPYVIENVDPCEDLIDPIRLCGTMFDGLRVIRHRLFESNIELDTPEHGRHPLVFTHDKRKAHYGKLDQNVSFVQVTGGGNATIANKGAAMGIDWMTGRELNEAIPPAYTEWLGFQLLGRLEVRAAA
jgi:C-5 cytosine-specific DNA methylase